MNRTPCAVAAVIALLCLAGIVSAPQDGFTPGNLFASSSSGTVTEFDLELVTGLAVPVTGLNSPEGIAFGPEGRLFVAESGAHRVRVFDSSGNLVATVGANSSLNTPMGLAFGPGETLYVTSFGSNTVRQYTSNGVFLLEFGAGSNLSGPTDIALGPTGHVFVSSFGTDEVLEFDPAGVLVERHGQGAGLDGPWGICFDRRGSMLVASHNNDRVLVFNATGNLIDTIGIGSGLVAPTDVILDGNGHVLVASWFSSDIVEFDSAGNELGLFATGSVDRPRGLGFAPYTFHAKLVGRLQATGDKERKIKEKVSITVNPGSGITTVRWLDPQGHLATTFGTDTLVFHGFEAYLNEQAHKRTYQGEEIPESPLQRGSASLVLTLKGKLTGSGRYAVKSAKGSLQRATPDGILNADVK